MKRIFFILVLAVVGLVGTMLAAGVRYPEMNPWSASTDGVGADGWTQREATLTFPSLLPRGNRLRLSLNPARPGTGPAHVTIAVCGNVVDEFSLQSDTREVLLRGGCDPREVRITVSNPVRAPDGREIGLQLNGASVTSRLRVPLLFDERVLVTALSLLFIGIIYLLITKSFFLALAIEGAGVLLIAKFYPGEKTLVPLFALVASIGAGYLSARYLSRRGRATEIDSKVWMFLALFACALGAALRFYGITFGLPHHYHPDEVPKVNAIMRMVENGDLNPRYFLHPSLLLYLTYGLNTIFHLFGMSGSFRETSFVAGRCVSAIAGTLAIFLLFQLGRVLYGRMVGSLAALALAVLPLHVTCSRYMKEDALLLFWLLLCLYLIIVSARSGSILRFILAGMVAGLAASSKYSGFLCIGLLGAAPWIRSGRIVPDTRFLFALPVAAGFGLVGFLIGTPYSVLDSGEFLRGMSIEHDHMLRGHTEKIDAWSQLWMYHFGRSVLPGMTIFTAMVSLFGVGLLIRRRKMEDLILLALICLFYLPAEWVKAKPAPQPERYILPCLPFLALAGSAFLRECSRRLGTALTGVLAVGFIALPLYRTATLASEIKNDTRIQATAWMKENLPAGAKVYLDWEPYAPRLHGTSFQVENDVKKTILPYLNVDSLKRSGADYLVLSSLAYGRFFSQPARKFQRIQIYTQIFERVPIVKEFAPKYGTYGFHNPVITIFSLKPSDFAALEGELQAKRRGEISETANDRMRFAFWKQ